MQRINVSIGVELYEMFWWYDYKFICLTIIATHENCFLLVERIIIMIFDDLSKSSILAIVASFLSLREIFTSR